MHKISFFKYILFLFVSIIASFFFCANAYSGAISPAAQNYTPNFWFDSQEQYYPANPLDFYFENNIEISGKKAVSRYNQLSQQEKINNLTVFYHIQDNGNQWVYQYWLFYVFNDYQLSVKNKHYGDWEAIYVFVDKNSNKINKAIGTSHQRKIFDTEIYNPEINHIWSYVGNGSHANCVDNNYDGYCDFFRWRGFEKFDKNGYKAVHNSYKLIEITPEFINKFHNSKTLENSPVLGINVFNFLMMDNKEFYLPLGGNPPIYAWEQSSYYNPNEIIPITLKHIAEYVLNKANQTKSAIAGFFNNAFSVINNIFSKVELENQQVNIINSLITEEPKQESEVKIEPKIESKEELKEIVITQTNSNEKEYFESNENKKSEEEKLLNEEYNFPENEIPEEEDNSVSFLNPPLNFPFFIGGGSISEEPISNLSSSTTTATTTSAVSTSTPDNISPSEIIDLTANYGNSRGTINLLWTAPGDDESSGTAAEYIIKYATSSINSLNWASSTDIIGEPNPSLASSSENFIISGLNINQTYYFAIKTKDESDNISNISNCASSSPQAKADNLVISEIQVKGNLASDEFIELYNPTNQDIDLSNWSIQYRGSESINFNKKNFVNGNIIPANGYFLIANNSYDGHMVADMSHNSFQMSATGGNVFLVNNQIELIDVNNNSVIDKLSYGSGTYLFPETEEFILAPGGDQSLERKNISTSTAESLAVNGDEHWQGNNWDSNNNNHDFVLQDVPNPQNSLALIEPRNSFANLADTAWPLFQGNFQHTGLSSYLGTATGTPTSTPKWTVNLGNNSPTSPIIGLNEEIYIGAGSGELYKITVGNATGTVELFYKIQTTATIQPPTIASDGTIYIADQYYLYALSSTGQLKWKYPVIDSSPPVIATDGTIYLGSGYYLYALNPNGELIWQSPSLSNGRWVTTATIDSQGYIYVTGKTGDTASVYKLNPDNGEVITSSSPRLLSNTPPALDNQGNLYVSAQGGYHGGWGLSSLDSSNLNERYFINNIGKLMSVPAIGSNGIIYEIGRAHV